MHASLVDVAAGGCLPPSCSFSSSVTPFLSRLPVPIPTPPSPHFRCPTPQPRPSPSHRRVCARERYPASARILQPQYVFINLNPFEVLQLPYTASDEEIKVRFRKVRKQPAYPPSTHTPCGAATPTAWPVECARPFLFALPVSWCSTESLWGCGAVLCTHHHAPPPPKCRTPAPSIDSHCNPVLICACPSLRSPRAPDLGAGAPRQELAPRRQACLRGYVLLI